MQQGHLQEREVRLLQQEDLLQLREELEEAQQDHEARDLQGLLEQDGEQEEVQGHHPGEHRDEDAGEGGLRREKALREAGVREEAAFQEVSVPRPLYFRNGSERSVRPECDRFRNHSFGNCSISSLIFSSSISNSSALSAFFIPLCMAFAFTYFLISLAFRSISSASRGPTS